MNKECLHTIKTRRSVRNFRPDSLGEEVLRDIVDCGRLAATARNVQPWEFVVVREQKSRERLAAICEYGKFIAQAPVCVAVFCMDTKYFLEDGCAALENILVAAWAYGIGSCWVAGDKKPYAGEVARLLGAPADCRLIGLIALGFPADPAAMPPKRPLDEVLHWERF